MVTIQISFKKLIINSKNTFLDLGAKFVLYKVAKLFGMLSLGAVVGAKLLHPIETDIAPSRNVHHREVGPRHSLARLRSMVWDVISWRRSWRRAPAPD